MRLPQEQLQDMLYAIERICKYLENIVDDEFSTKHDSFWGIVKLVEMVGECAKSLPKALLDENPQIPWNELARTRDRFSHGYFDLSARLVLEIAKRLRNEVLPEVKRMLESDNSNDA